MSGHTGISRFLPVRCGKIGLGCAMRAGCTHPIISLVCDTYKLIIKLSPILLNVLVRNHVYSFSTQCDLDEVFLSELLTLDFLNQI